MTSKLLLEAQQQAKARAKRVVVYGTLRRKQSNNVVLGDSKFLGMIIIPKSEGLVMLDATNGGFPIVMPAKGTDFEATSIIAELYAVSDETMQRLDKLEGAPTMYHRETITVKNRGQDVKATIYHATKGYFGLDDAEQIEDGNWNTHSERLEQEEEEGRSEELTRQATGRDGGVYYRYAHNDGQGLMNNGSLNYDKLDDDESFEVEDEYLGLQQPHQSDHGKSLIFAFTPEGERKHRRLIELLSKASKTGVKKTELNPRDYEVEWESSDGQVGLKKKTGGDDV